MEDSLRQASLRLTLPLVCRSVVDPAGKAGNDDQILLPEIVGEAAGEAAGGVARADDRHRRPVEEVQITLGHQQGRRVFELGEETRIEPLPQSQVARAELIDSRDLALGLVAAEQSRRQTAAAPRQIGDGRKRLARAPEPGNQLAKGDRPDPG